MSGYNVTTPSLFTVADPIKQLSNKVTLNSVMSFPSVTNTVSTNLIPARATIGGAHIVLTSTNPKWDSAANILAELRRQALFVSGKQLVLPNGTLFQVTVYNNSGSDVTIDASDDGTTYYDVSDGDVSNECSHTFQFIINQQKALGDANDWISVIDLDY
jgi:hypothetical protein